MNCCNSVDSINFKNAIFEYTSNPVEGLEKKEEKKINANDIVDDIEEMYT